MNKKLYDIIKWGVITALPAITAFIIFVGPLWGISDDSISVISGTLVAATTLLGTLVGISSAANTRRREIGEVEYQDDIDEVI
jgi:hypothetical protein